jgi:hypothetical protein
MPLRVQYIYDVSLFPWRGRSVNVLGFWLRRRLNLGADYLQHRKTMRIRISTPTGSPPVSGVFANNHDAATLATVFGGSGSSTAPLDFPPLSRPNCVPPRCSPGLAAPFAPNSALYIQFAAPYPVPANAARLVLDVVVDDILDTNNQQIFGFYEWIPDSTGRQSPRRGRDALWCAQGASVSGTTACTNCGSGPILPCETNGGLAPGEPFQIRLATNHASVPAAGWLGNRLTPPVRLPWGDHLYVGVVGLQPGVTQDASACGLVEFDWGRAPLGLPVGFELGYQFAVLDTTTNQPLLSCGFTTEAAGPAPPAGHTARVINNGPGFQPDAPGASGSIDDTVLILGVLVQ